MFIKRKLPDLKGSVDLSRVKDFSLFTQKTKSQEQQPADVVDTIDVEARAATQTVASEPSSTTRNLPSEEVLDVEPVTEVIATNELEVRPSGKKVSLKFGLGNRLAAKSHEPPPAQSSEAPAGESPPEVPASTAENRLKGMFAKKRPASTVASAAAAPVSKKKTLWSFGKKDAKTQTAEQPEGAARTPTQRTEPSTAKKVSSLFGKAVKEKTKTLKAGDTAGSFKPGSALDILIELENERRTYWRVSADRVMSIEPAEMKVGASFSKAEIRLFTGVTVNYKGAQDLALSEFGEAVRIVNASQKLQAVYATSASRIENLSPLKSGPGLLLLETLLKNERPQEEDFISGFHLESQQAGLSLAILFHFKASGEVSPVQVTVNPDNLSFVISQFATSHRLDADNVKILLFKNEELLAAARHLEFYPAEAVWAGYSVRKLLWAASAVAAAGAGAAALYAGQAYIAKSWNQNALEKAQAEKRALDQSIDQVLQASVTSFAKTQSLDVAKTFEVAQHLWLPGGAVTLEATPSLARYAVTLPFSRGSIAGGKPSMLNPVSTEELSPLLRPNPPEGCDVSPPLMPGALNAVQIVVTCESPSGPLSRYRLE